MTRLILRSLRPGDSGKRRALLGYLIVALVSTFYVSTLRPQAARKNRVIISEGDKLKAYEFNPATSKFDQVWESASTAGTATPQRGSYGWIGEPVLADINRDGKNELLAIDRYGIFVWGKNGKYPQYFCFPNSMREGSLSQILPVEINNDSSVEFVTQGWGGTSTTEKQGKRLIASWKLVQNRLEKLTELALPGSPSWSLRYEDCDNDGSKELLSSGSLIHIMRWDKSKKLIEEYRFPNLASVIDVIRVGDVDNDGENEIVASGNSSCFTVYKVRKNWAGTTYYPVVYQSEPFSGMTQGLQIADVDGDGKNELLVGDTGSKPENLFVYEAVKTNIAPNYPIRFKKTFAASVASSSIPGFVVGDVDNDGKNEVIYNNKYVMKFTRDSSGSLQYKLMDQLTAKTASGAAVGPFEPNGPDTPIGFRLIPALNFAIKKEIFASGSSYKCWLKITNVFGDAKNIHVQLKSEDGFIAVENAKVSIGNMASGQIYSNEKQPFILRPVKRESPTRFRLTAIVTADGGYETNVTFSSGIGSDNRSFSFYMSPKIDTKSDTLAFSSPDNMYKSLGFAFDYFNDNAGGPWPSKEILEGHRNLIVLDEDNDALGDNIEKLQSFLDNRGNFFAHGHHITEYLYSASQSEFVSKYFNAKYAKEYSGEKKVAGVKGDVISEGLSFDLQDNANKNNPCVLEPSAGAIPIFYYPTGEVAGIRVDGKYKFVYLEFALQDIKSLETRRELVRRILAWFNGK